VGEGKERVDKIKVLEEQRKAEKRLRGKPIKVKSAGRAKKDLRA